MTAATECVTSVIDGVTSSARRIGFGHEEWQFTGRCADSGESRCCAWWAVVPQQKQCENQTHTHAGRATSAQGERLVATLEGPSLGERAQQPRRQPRQRGKGGLHSIPDSAHRERRAPHTKNRARSPSQTPLQTAQSSGTTAIEPGHAEGRPRYCAQNAHLDQRPSAQCEESFTEGGGDVKRDELGARSRNDATRVTFRWPAGRSQCG